MYNANTPTIFLLGPYRIVINIKDHGPAHVHCVGPSVYVVIEIVGQKVVRNKGVSSKDVQRLQNVVEEYEDVLLNEWRRYHEED